MVRKMVLVPEEMYRGMLSSSETLGDTARVMEAKQAVTSVLRSRKKPGVRRVLYDKKIRDFLKLRKEAVDRPVKVEFNQTSVAQEEEQVKPAAAASKNKNRRRKIPTSSPPGTHVPPGQVYMPPPPPPSGQETPRGAPRRSESAGPTPRTTSRRNILQQEKAQKENAIADEMKKLIDYVNENRSRFGVTEDGRIIGKNAAEVKHSSIESAVRGIVHPIPAASGTPPGTSYLRSRLQRDPQGQELIKRVTNYARFQYGLGKTRTTVAFKPALWKRY